MVGVASDKRAGPLGTETGAESSGSHPAAVSGQLPGKSSQTHKLANAMEARVTDASGKPAQHGKSFLGMAPAADNDEPSSTKYKRMVESVLKEPPLYMLKFGKIWSQDALAFHHNAMRRELQDMYYLVSSMGRRVTDLTNDDISDFYEWFDLFRVFFKDFFALEEQVLIPWLDTKVPPDQMPFMRGPRTQRKTDMQASLVEIDECQGRFANLPAGEVLPILARSLDRFAPSVVSYMSDREKDTLPLIARYFTSLDKARYDNSLLDWVKASPNSFMLWHLLIRPVSKAGGEHAALRKKFIDSESGLLARMRMRKQYKLSQQEVRDAHYGIVIQFYRRWGKAAIDANQDSVPPANAVGRSAGAAAAAGVGLAGGAVAAADGVAADARQSASAGPALKLTEEEDEVVVVDNEAEFVVTDFTPEVPPVVYEELPLAADEGEANREEQVLQMHRAETVFESADMGDDTSTPRTAPGASTTLSDSAPLDREETQFISADSSAPLVNASPAVAQ